MNVRDEIDRLKAGQIITQMSRGAFRGILEEIAGESPDLAADRFEARCASSRKKDRVRHQGLPLFWTVKIERHFIKMDAVQRQDGLAALLGGSARLAQVMGTDEEMTERVLGPVTITVCETCAMGNICLAQLAEEKED